MAAKVDSSVASEVASAVPDPVTSIDGCCVGSTVGIKVVGSAGAYKKSLVAGAPEGLDSSACPAVVVTIGEEAKAKPGCCVEGT